MKTAPLSILLIVLLFCVVVVNAPAQDLDANLHAPFVSHLDAQLNVGEVILGWRDAPGLGSAVYEIFRSDSEIRSGDFADAERIAVVASGIETFTDRPPEGKPWWYAVITVSGGKRFDMVIPWRNATGMPIIVAERSRRPDKSAKVRALTAELDGGDVRLDFVADSETAAITVFRNPEPFVGPEKLDHAVEVGTRTGSAGTLIDSPIPGVTWYYAAVGEALFRAGDAGWMASAAFSNPVTPLLMDEDGRMSLMRPAPLPRLRITRSFADGRPIPEIDGELPERQRLSATVLTALSGILGPIRGELWTEPEPVILEVDRGFSDNRLQQNLSEILDGSFGNGEWESADSELFALSASNGIDEAMKARIQFYRGQCQYYRGNLQSAFLSFLYASDFYYLESRAWMLTIYDDITPVS